MNPLGAGGWETRTTHPEATTTPLEASPGLSEGCIRELYLHNRCEAKHPCVQLLDFEQSQANQKQITVRISDGVHFVDCTLFGNYSISNNTVIQTKNASTITTYRRNHIVKLVDYFSKIDDTRISKLKIIVRKIAEVTSGRQIIGEPHEIHQFMVNTAAKEAQTEVVTAKKVREKDGNIARQEYQFTNKQEFPNVIKLQNAMDVEFSSNHTPPPLPTPTPTPTPLKNIKKETQSQPESQSLQTPPNGQNHTQNQGLNESLTLSQILNGKEGFLIGRLLRFKAAKKQTKESIMTVCYLGLVDRHGELIRVHLAGRLAMNNQKTLKKNRSYYIRGFDLVNIKNSSIPQIRLKEKEYKIVQVHNEELTKQLPFEYYCWDHQTHESQPELEFVDVIGVIEDIEEKATYTVDTKSVIRVVLKNKFKSIRISFWTDQMKNFENFNLKRKEGIIVEDIRKKQGKYYDFSLESTLIHLTEFPFLQQKFAHLLPEVTQTAPPQNIHELDLLYGQDPQNGKLHTLKAYLVGFKDKKVIYRLCDDCKKKVEKEATQCQECASQNLVFKFNWAAEFSDSTGSLVVILFDAAGQKLIGRSANEVSCMVEEEIERLFETLFYKFYSISVQNRNQRIILRNIQLLDQSEQAAQMRQNLEKIIQEGFKEIQP